MFSHSSLGAGRRRLSLGTSILTTSALAALSLTAPVLGQPLDNCTPGGSNPSAMLPLGTSTQAGYGWKFELYSWLQSLGVTDFDYQGQPTDIEPPYVAYGVYPSTASWVNELTCESDWAAASITLGQQDETYIEQYYTLVEQRQDWYDEFLRIDPAIFTLAEMEDEVSCEVKTPHIQWDGTPAWVSMWPYPGNPFNQDPVVAPALKKRLGSWLALQLIMLDWAAWDGVGQTIPPATPAPQNTLYHHPNPIHIGGVDGSLGMGIALTGMASAYEAIKNESWFTAALAASFEDGLLTHAERLDEAGYYAQQANRAVPMVSGQQMVYNATGDPNAATWYQNAMQSVFTPSTFYPAGYLTQDFRWDPGYSKMDPHSAVRLLVNHDNNLPAPVDLFTAAEAMHDLRAHMTFADYTGLFLGPSAMSTRTGGGVNSNANEPSGDPHRVTSQLYAAELGLPFADAVLRDHSDFGTYGLRPAAPFTRWADPLDPNRDFTVVLACRWSPLAPFGTGVWTQLSDQQKVWPDQPAPRGYLRPWMLNWNHEVPTTGSLFAQRENRVVATPDLNLMPFELEGPYFRNIEDEVVFAKYGDSGVFQERAWNICPFFNEYQGYQGAEADLAAIVHTGPVVGGNHALPYGYGGGQLAGLWSPQTGVSVLNRRTGRNNPPTVDDWTQWRRLPIHASTLLTDRNVWTSSSRVLQPKPTIILTSQDPSPSLAWNWLTTSSAYSLTPVAQANAVSAFIEVKGLLPSEGHDVTAAGTMTPALDPSLPIEYRRRFVIEPHNVHVRTTLDPMASGAANTDPLFEAWETLPLFIGETNLGNCTANVANVTAKVEFVIFGGGSVNVTGTTAPVNNVVEVRVSRNDGTMKILFQKPWTMRLSDVYGDQSSAASRRFLLQNLMIDLRPPGAGSKFQLPSVDLTYTINFHN